MPSYSGFRSIKDYLDKKCLERQLSYNALSEALGYTHGYIHAIANETFSPSIKAANKIASFFNDTDGGKTVRILCGLEVPSKSETAQPEEKQMAEQTKELSLALPIEGQRELLEYANYLRRKYISGSSSSPKNKPRARGSAG